jgi:isopentenyl diphosphate isomerase/L-lactate dehydrogenase-like FMN-dependent dehydrogenase
MHLANGLNPSMMFAAATSAMMSKPHNINDMRLAAKQRLPRAVFEWVDRGAEDEVTMRANRRSFEEVLFVPRAFADVSSPDLTTSVAGADLRIPIVLAPAGLTGLVHPDGELGAAIAAVQAGGLAVISGHGSYTLEEAAARAPGSLWFGAFPWKDRTFLGEIVDRVRSAAYAGLVLTTDTVVVGNRERDVVNGFTVPPRFALRNMIEYALHPKWVYRTLRSRRVTLRNFQSEPVRLRSFFKEASQSASRTVGFMNQAFGWDDLQWLREKWSGPLAMKGAYSVADAKRLAEIGIDVIFLGNHGGRQLDGLMSGISQLPAIVEAVGDRIDIVVDGGVRRGTDVVKALCMGARACMIGRPWVYGLAVDGTAGVSTTLDIFRDEIRRTLALLGIRSIADLSPSLIHSLSRVKQAPPPSAHVGLKRSR